MRYVKWVFWLVILTLVTGFLHYTLPQRDVVRIVGTEVRRVDFGENSIFWSGADTGQDAASVNRDVRFINAVRANGRVTVYRNEDTGWGWPPYFKFDTTNLQAEAGDMKSLADEPKYALIKHYGWRNEFWSIFPNAISVKPVDGPNASKGFPILNTIILTLFGAFVYFIWVRWRRFRMARIDPTLEEIQDNWEAAGDAVEDGSGRLRRWFKSLRGK